MVVRQEDFTAAFTRAVAKQRPSADGAYSTRELGDLLGWGTDKVRVALRGLIEAGAWEPVRAMRPTIAGLQQNVVVYRPVAAGNGRRKRGRGT